MNGIEEIIVERINQLDKHGYTVADDVSLYTYEELLGVTSSLINRNNARWPSGWDMAIFHRWMREPRIAQLAKAGAFIAAEIDRLKLNNEEKSE